MPEPERVLPPAHIGEYSVRCRVGVWRTRDPPENRTAGYLLAALSLGSVIGGLAAAFAPSLPQLGVVLATLRHSHASPDTSRVALPSKDQ